MSKDIEALIERLRSRPGEAITRTEKLMDEVADALSSLREENERLRKERDEALAKIDSMTPKFVAYEYLESPAGREIAETALSTSQAQLKIYRGHIENLIGLLELIKKDWIDYDHVFTLGVHEARTALSQEAGK